MQPLHRRRLGGLFLGLTMTGALLPAMPVGAADPVVLADTHEDEGDLTWDSGGRDRGRACRWRQHRR